MNVWLKLNQPWFSYLCFFSLCVCDAAQGLDHIAENILSFLDARSLCSAELVCKEWQRVISEGMLWKKLIERMVRTDPLWKGLSERHQWWGVTATHVLLHSTHLQTSRTIRFTRVKAAFSVACKQNETLTRASCALRTVNLWPFFN